MKKLIFTFLMLFAFNASSAVITYVEDTNPALDNVFLNAGQSTVDTTTGLEWLKFRDYGDVPATDYTLGHSINSAESAYGNQGWYLPSATQVSNLFDSYFTDFIDSGDGTQVINGEDPSLAIIQSRNSWIFGFGSDAVVDANGNATLDNNVLSSRGLFLNDDGSIGFTGIKMVVDPTTFNITTTLSGPNVSYSTDTRNTAFTDVGVFMVREYVPAVPVPAAVWLFGSGLLGLVAVARRKT